MTNETYFETFATAIDGAVASALDARVVLSKPTELWSLCQEPLHYNDTRRASFPVLSLRDKPTRKFFHVVICRLDSGRYELTTYVL
jgi:hypothetical protein